MSRHDDNRYDDINLSALDQRAEDYDQGQKADNTRDAYASDWRDFVQFCDAIGAAPLPATPDTLVRYLTTLAPDYAVSTMERRLAAIRHHHERADHPTPIDERVRSVWHGIRSDKRIEQDGKEPISLDDLRLIVQSIYHAWADGEIGPLRAYRDRALLVTGWAGALRRSELVALNIDDLQPVARGLVVTIRRSKTDPLGRGDKIGLPWGEHTETVPVPGGERTIYPTCPRRALEDYMTQAEIESGPLFRGVTRYDTLRKNPNDGRLSDKTVARTVKTWIEAIGHDPSDYAGHSLRSGFVTEAAERGEEDRSIMRQTRHASADTMQTYARPASVFNDNAVTTLDL